MRKVDINISSLLELLPRYQVRTTTKIEWMRVHDKCVVSLLHTDMTKEVIDSIRASIEMYTTSFDQFVGAFNSNKLLQE